MLLAFSRDKPESGLGSRAWDVESPPGFWSGCGQLSCYGYGLRPGWSCPETGPLCHPPGPWLQTRMEKGQEQHLPPSSSALLYQFRPANIPSTFWGS